VLALSVVLFTVGLQWVLPIVTEYIAIRYVVLEERWNPLAVAAIAILIILNAATLLTNLVTLKNSGGDAIRTGVDLGIDIVKSAGAAIPPELHAFLTDAPQQTAPSAAHAEDAPSDAIGSQEEPPSALS
jgi:hypothetical protein